MTQKKSFTRKSRSLNLAFLQKQWPSNPYPWVAHLNTIMTRGGDNLDEPNLKSSTSRRVSVLKRRIDRRITAVCSVCEQALVFGFRLTVQPPITTSTAVYGKSYWNLCHYSAIKHPMNVEFSSKTKIRAIIFTTNWHWGGIDIFPHQVDNSVTGLCVVMVIWLFYLPERYSVFFLQSSMSISAVPEITSSSSRASKRLTKLASNTFGKKWRHVMIHPEKRVIKHAIIIVYMI